MTPRRSMATAGVGAYCQNSVGGMLKSGQDLQRQAEDRLHLTTSRTCAQHVVELCIPANASSALSSMITGTSGTAAESSRRSMLTCHQTHQLNKKSQEAMGAGWQAAC